MGNSEVVRLCFAMTGAAMSDIEYPEPQKACREPLFEVNAQDFPREYSLWRWRSLCV
jgi:hypothetical protein